MFTRRAGIVGSLAVIALLLMGARCIDNETLYRDGSGSWHVVGEVHNETDVQGTGIIVGGTLFDAADNVIGTARTAACPLELSPQSFTAFDLQFDYDGDTRPARYDVRLVDGKAIEGVLPDSGLNLAGFTAKTTADGLLITGDVENDGPRTYRNILTGCVAIYNAEGRVITHVTLVNFGLTLPLRADSSQPVGFELPAAFVEAGAHHVKLWLAGDAAKPFASDYAYTMTGDIPVR